LVLLALVKLCWLKRSLEKQEYHFSISARNLSKCLSALGFAGADLKQKKTPCLIFIDEIDAVGDSGYTAAVTTKRTNSQPATDRNGRV